MIGSVKCSTLDEAEATMDILLKQYIEQTECPLMNGYNCRRGCPCLFRGRVIPLADDHYEVQRPVCRNGMFETRRDW